MPYPVPARYAFNLTRHAYLATQLSTAATHWSRFRGLMFAVAKDFSPGMGLWIVPSRGVHTLAMRFSIDVAYLDRDAIVVHLEPGLPPWRLAPIRRRATSVLELPASTLAATGTKVGDQIKIGCREGSRSDLDPAFGAEELAR